MQFQIGTFQIKTLLATLTIFLLAACAPPQAKTYRFFWPPPNDEPKIEFINYWQSSEDLKRGTDRRLEEAILGKEPPKRLFFRPFDIASDGHGLVYVSDLALGRVTVLDIPQHKYTFLKSMKGDDFQFRLPAGLAVIPAGGVWVSDSEDGKVFEFGSDGRLIRIIGSGQLTKPKGLCFDALRDRLYVVNSGTHQVKVFNSTGDLLQTIGNRGNRNGEFNYPLDVDLDRDGNLYVLDALNARVQVFDPDGEFLRGFGERGTAIGSFQVPKAIAVTPAGQVYVTDSLAHRMVIFDLEGHYLLTVGGQYVMTDSQVAPGGFYLPEGVDADANDTIWVVDSLNRIVHEFQYLNEHYLAEHPILPGQSYVPNLSLPRDVR